MAIIVRSLTKQYPGFTALLSLEGDLNLPCELTKGGGTNHRPGNNSNLSRHFNSDQS